VTPPIRYNVKQAAELIGKSPSWLYKKGAAREIPRSKLGHHVWWTPEQIAQILQGAAQEPKQRKPREEQPAEQRRKSQPPKRRTQPKHATAPTNSKIPVADFNVSRLYKKGDAA
jgi:predicted DNA-binding transcriptional regulator AlpA